MLRRFAPAIMGSLRVPRSPASDGPVTRLVMSPGKLSLTAAANAAGWAEDWLIPNDRCSGSANPGLTAIEAGCDYHCCAFVGGIGGTKRTDRFRRVRARRRGMLDEQPAHLLAKLLAADRVGE